MFKENSHIENAENYEIKEKLERLFSITQEMVRLSVEIEESDGSGKVQELWKLSREKDILCEEMAFVLNVDFKEMRFNDCRNVEMPVEFFEIVKSLDKKILELEKIMGIEVDFFIPESFEKLLETIIEMRKRNFNEFNEELNSDDDINSRAFFWSVRFSGDGRDENLKLNWPIELSTSHSFSHRLIARFFINEIRKSGIELDEDSEKIILKAFPFGSTLEFNNSNLEDDIYKEEKASINEFRKLPKAEEMAIIAEKISRKLFVLSNLGHSEEEIRERLTKEELESFDPKFREIMNKYQGRKELHFYLGHMFPKCSQPLRFFLPQK